VESITEEAEEEDNETEEVILPPVEKVEPVEEKIEGDVHSLSIEKLQLSVRSNNCLKRDRINTIGDLLARSPSELLKIRNFGQKSLDEVQEKLKTLFNITYEETEEKK
jgi:DNA-directed RNA polymerase subunit alpha